MKIGLGQVDLMKNPAQTSGMISEVVRGVRDSGK